jgi:DNA-binding MarR family transcriptional regulator
VEQARRHTKAIAAVHPRRKASARLSRTRAKWHETAVIGDRVKSVAKHADVSLLFDFFVTGQRLRKVLSDALEEAGMRPDEYAVYSLLFEKGNLTATEMAAYLGMPLSTILDYLRAMTAAGRVVRTSHPFDGRAMQLSLNRSGVVAHRRANAHWEVVRRLVEEGLTVPIPTIRSALQALDDSAYRAAKQMRSGRLRASSR